MIERYDINEDYAHSGIIKAGDFYYLGYCAGNIGGTIEEQMDCLFRDVWNISVMEEIIRKRFNGKYPVRKTIQTEFAHRGGENDLLFQVDGIAYKENM